MTPGVMGLGPEEFWTDPDRTRQGVARSALDGEWRGYAIDAPPVVELAARDTLPVLGLRCLSAVESARADFHRNAVVVAVRLDSNEVFADAVFAWKYSPPRANPKPKAPPSPTIALAEAFDFEVRARLPALPWAPGTVRLTLLVLDAASEPVDVKLRGLSGGGGTYTPALRDRAWPPPGEGRPPTYERTGQSPAVPASPGISLVGDRVVLLTHDAWCFVQGSFRLPVTAFDVPSWNDDAPTLERISVDAVALAEAASEGPRPVAFVPITFVLTGGDLVAPWVCTAVAPSFDTPRVPGDAVTGWFSFDLYAMPGFPRAAGTYHLWAFSGPVVAGPEPIALVAEDRLAPA